GMTTYSADIIKTGDDALAAIKDILKALTQFSTYLPGSLVKSIEDMKARFLAAAGGGGGGAHGAGSFDASPDPTPDPVPSLGGADSAASGDTPPASSAGSTNSFSSVIRASGTRAPASNKTPAQQFKMALDAFVSLPDLARGLRSSTLASKVKSNVR